jgi:NAD(P)H:quinone oxidoreductase type IV
MSTKVHVIFYSMYGHVWRMAEAVGLYQVSELVPDAILEQSGAKKARAQFAQIPFATLEQLSDADAIIFGTPTRFGNMAAQMRNFLDQTGGLWMQGALINKIGSVFTSTASQHGGQETTITSFHNTLLHHGMIVVGTPYSEPALSNMDEITGGTPYGASTITKADGSRLPSENELKIARFQGRHVATLAKQFKAGARVN